MTEPLDPEARDFLVAEAQFVGERSAWYLAQQQTIENLGLLASGAIWAFVLSRPYPAAALIAWLPFLITLILGTKSHLFNNTISLMYDYVYEVEGVVGLPPDRGWIHYFRSHAAKNSTYKRQWRNAFWILLVSLNLLAALLLAAGVLVPQS